MDYRLFRLINGLAGRSHVFDSIARAIAQKGIIVFPLILVALWIFPGKEAHRVRLAVVLAAVACLVAILIAQPISAAVHRPRPYASHAVHPLLARSGDHSFPSDHTTFSMAFAAALWPVRRKTAVAMAILAVVVGVSRIICGVHYPGDILGGISVGIAAAALLWWVGKRPLDMLTRAIERIYWAILRQDGPVAA